MVWVATAIMALVGCGVPTDSDPRAIPPEEVPYGLLRPSADPRAGPMTPEEGGQIQVFFLRGERLAPATRRVRPVASVEGVMRHLLRGPNRDEAAEGLRSAIGPRSDLLGIRMEGRVAVIDLNADFVEIQGEEQLLAVAQLVFSATGVAGVDAVTLLLEGKPVEVPTGEGTLTGRPLTRGDFTRFSPS